MRIAPYPSFAWRAVAAVALAALAHACAAPHAAPQQQIDPTTAIDAYRQGVAEAIQELRQNAPTIYTAVQPNTEIDADTNLPLKSAGGPTNPFQLYRLLGHNDFIRGYLGAPLGPPVPH